MPLSEKEMNMAIIRMVRENRKRADIAYVNSQKELEIALATNAIEKRYEDQDFGGGFNPHANLKDTDRLNERVSEAHRIAAEWEQLEMYVIEKFV